MEEQNTIPHLFITFFTLIFALVLFASACNKADRETAATQNEELAKHYIEAYNAQDIDALQAVLADNIVMYGNEEDQEFLLNLIRGAWNLIPDIHLEPEIIAGSEDYVTVRLVLTGTGNGEFAGHDIDGKEVEVTEIMLLGITDGQISKFLYNWDELGFLTQLGVIESPYPVE